MTTNHQCIAPDNCPDQETGMPCNSCSQLWTRHPDDEDCEEHGPSCCVRTHLGGPDDEQPDFRPAIIRGLDARFKAVLAACELAEAEARHVVDDEVYVSVGLIRNALRTPTPAGGPDDDGIAR